MGKEGKLFFRALKTFGAFFLKLPLRAVPASAFPITINGIGI